MENEEEFAEFRESLKQGSERMDRMQQAIDENTVLTETVVTNTAGLLEFIGDVTAGTKLMCRIAKGVSWLVNDVIKPLWLPGLLLITFVYWIFHNHQFPAWLGAFLIKAAT